MHLNWLGLLGGGLKGTLPNPLVAPDEASLAISKQVFGRQPYQGWDLLVATGRTDNTRNYWLIQTGSNGQMEATPRFVSTFYVNNNFSNQATFNNTATNISGCSFKVGVGETWIFRFFVPLRATAGTTGVGFNLTVPTSTTGAMQIIGATSGVTAETTIYTTALTTNTAKSFCTVATTDLWVEISGMVTGATVAGTVQLQGQSGGATTTIQINKGANTMAQQSF